MLIVADSSPLNLLIDIGYAEVLPVLFQKVVIPTEVAAELSRPRTPQVVREFVTKPPVWMEIHCAALIAAAAPLRSGLTPRPPKPKRIQHCARVPPSRR